MDILNVNCSTSENEALDCFRAIYTNETSYNETKESLEKSNIAIKLSKEFQDMLTPEQTKKYHKLYDAIADQEAQNEDEEFIKGFKIAVRLLFDCFR